MRILVTGGTGYIGATAVEMMRAQGYEITILDDCSTGHADSVPAGAHFVNAEAVRRAMQFFRDPFWKGAEAAKPTYSKKSGRQ